LVGLSRIWSDWVGSNRMGSVGRWQRRCPSRSGTVGCLAWQGEASRRADAVHASRGAARRDASPYPRNRRRTVSRQARFTLFQLPNHWRLSNSAGVPPSGGGAVASKRRLKPGHPHRLPSRRWAAFPDGLLPRRKLRVCAPAPFQRQAKIIVIFSLRQEKFIIFSGPPRFHKHLHRMPTQRLQDGPLEQRRDFRADIVARLS
jgi:hypothetical protein